MYSFLTKHGQMIAFVLGVVISLIFMVIVLSADSTSGLDAETFTNKELPDVKAMLSGFTQFDFGLYATYGLLILTALAAIGFGLYHFIMSIVDNPRSVMKTIAMIVGVIVIFLIAYSMAPGDSQEVVNARDAFKVSDGQSQFISGAINTTIVMSLLAVVALLASEVRNAFK